MIPERVTPRGKHVGKTNLLFEVVLHYSIQRYFFSSFGLHCLTRCDWLKRLTPQLIFRAIIESSKMPKATARAKKRK